MRGLVGRTLHGVAVVASSVTSSAMLVATDLGVFRSDTGGGQWLSAGRGLPDFDGQGRHGLASAGSLPCIAYVGTPVGVYKTTDGGDTWAATGLTWPPTASWRAEAIAVDRRDADLVYVGVNIDGGIGKIVRSSDGGATWREVWQGEDVHSIAVAHGSSMVIVGTRSGILWTDVGDG